ncbi:MAG: hypothetical protein JNM66_19115 [Bryobacterales bacterium]|nr:hypothetical protein [Bryobacterales bacterium]
MFVRKLLLLIGCGGVLGAQCSHQFNDTQETIRVSNGTIELVLARANGAIQSITHLATGTSPIRGQRGSLLWGLLFKDSGREFLGSSAYSSTGPNRFSYTWQAPALRLSYDGDPAAANRVSARLTITIPCGNYFDIDMQLTNNWGQLLEVRIPSELVFRRAEITDAILPALLPGVRLAASYFLQDVNYAQEYPSKDFWADYYWLQSNRTSISVYTLQPQNVRHAKVGFLNDDRDRSQIYALHNFYADAKSGESDSLPTVRIRIGDSITQSIDSLRIDSGLATAPTVAEKAGSELEKWIASPFSKFDMVHLGKSFKEAGTSFTRLPPGQTVHIVSTNEGGFDRNNWDPLPPAQQLGSITELRSLVDNGYRFGLRFNAYMNNVWTDLNTPTLKNLPAGLKLEDIAVLDSSGRPISREYNGILGVFPDPCKSFVGDRNRRNLAELRSLGFKEFLLDQVGSVGIPRKQYLNCWLQILSLQPQGSRYDTEDGTLPLTWRFVGYHGSLLPSAPTLTTADQALRAADGVFGVGQTTMYPLAQLLLGQSVLFYQHDLNPNSFTHSVAVLTFNAATGTNLSYIPPGLRDGPQDESWSSVVETFQRRVFARLAGRRMTAFNSLPSQATESTWPGMTVYANWNSSSPLVRDTATIAPGGFLATSTDGSLVAGALSAYNGNALTAGAHLLIVERSPCATVLWHPLGPDTPVFLTPPDARPGQLLALRAIDEDGYQIGGDIPLAMEGRLVRVNAERTRGGKRVGRYELTYGPALSALVNNASYLEPLAPGMLAAAFGARLEGAVSQARVGGLPASVLYTTMAQSAFSIPFAMDQFTRSQAEFVTGGCSTGLATVRLVPSAPGIFTLDATGRGQAAALNEDFSANTSAAPVTRGKTVVLWATGQGTTEPPSKDGEITREPLPRALARMTAKVGGVDAEVSYGGPAPGLIAGISQINVIVPANAPTGPAVPIVVLAGDSASQDGVTIAVQ